VNPLRLANLSNGLPYPHDMVCYFQSQFGHQKKLGYFRMDSMPYDAVLQLLRGGIIRVIDATQHDKPMTDAQRYGVTTWCLVFNRAIRSSVLPAKWVTRDMVQVARSGIHKSLVHSIRRCSQIIGAVAPAIVGENVILECHRQIKFDDKPGAIRDLLATTCTASQSLV